MKPWWQRISKTLVVNILVLIVATLGQAELQALLGEQALAVALQVVAVVNVILRMITYLPVSWLGLKGE